MERILKLEDLAKRHPDAAADVKKVDFEVDPPIEPPTGGGGSRLKDSVRNFAIGLLVLIAGAWMLYYFPWVVPPSMTQSDLKAVERYEVTLGIDPNQNHEKDATAP